MVRALLVFIVFIFLKTNLPAQQIASSASILTTSSVDADHFHILKVFPNPVEDYIQITKNSVVDKIHVYSLVGKKVKSFQYHTDERYYLGDVRKGIYLIQLKDQNNKILTTKRISKN